MNTGIAFEIGPIVVHWYGLLVVVGALLGAYVATREARRRGENPAHVWNALIWCLLLGLVGARAYHVFSSPAVGSGGFDYYTENPLAVLMVWDGGLGLYGAIAGGALALLVYARRNDLSVWRWFDIGAPGLALAQALGRWSHWINQELYGPPTDLPWGLYIDAQHRIPRYGDLDRYPTLTTRFHPTFLYHSLWDLGLFLLLTWVGRRWASKLRDGDVFLAYLVLFGIGRAWIEQFFRADAWRLENGLAVATLISLALAVVAGVTMYVRHRRLVR